MSSRQHHPPEWSGLAFCGRAFCLKASQKGRGGPRGTGWTTDSLICHRRSAVSMDMAFHVIQAARPTSNGTSPTALCVPVDPEQVIALGVSTRERASGGVLSEAPRLSTRELRIVVARLLVAVACGGLIGLERWAAGAVAGFRTTSLTALGSAVFTLNGMILCGSQTARIVAQIVSGVGFIGAGCLTTAGGFHQRRGLSTATSIWISASVGVASAFGLYSVAIIATSMTLLILRYANWKLLSDIKKRANPRPEEDSSSWQI